MGLIHSYDFNHLPNIQDLFIGWLFGMGMTSLFKKFKISIKLADIRNNCNWIRIIFIHGISFVVLGYIEQFFEKVKLKPVAKLVSKLNMKNFKSGFKFLAKEYPALMYPIFKELEKYNLAFKLQKITGIKPDLED